MNNLIIYLTLIHVCFMVPSTCLKQSTTKLCVGCKFFKTDFPFSFNKEFGKCTQFPKIIDEDSNFLVTGIKKKQKIEYQYCSIVRKYENKCGQEGKLYEEK